MKHLLFLAMAFLVSPLLFSQAVSVIPVPLKMETAKGHFTMSRQTTLVFDENNLDLMRISRIFNEHLQQYYGFSLPINKKEGTSVWLEISPSGVTTEEGYALDVSQTGITVSATTPAGIFYGLQTLKQLLPTSSDNTNPLNIPCIVFFDNPRFGWRGLHLDVSRHYYPVTFITRYIDFMAMYKLNTFHWQDIYANLIGLLNQRKNCMVVLKNNNGGSITEVSNLRGKGLDYAIHDVCGLKINFYKYDR